jgi:indole-3-glycerol phosphate synthase
MEDVLARIAAYKRNEVAARKAQSSLVEIERLAAQAEPPRGFRRALETASRPGHPALIGEIKKASPSKGLIRPAFQPDAIARAYETGGAACLSVLTDGPSFQGGDDDLRAARGASALPCLRKDFLLDPWQVMESRALGADCILVILAMVSDRLAETFMSVAGQFGMDALVEVHDEAEMARAVDLGATLIGVNNRSLHTFEVDLAVTERLGPLAPTTSLLVAESGIFTPADVSRVAQNGVRALLVGESLMRQHDVAAAARTLLR